MISFQSSFSIEWIPSSLEWMYSSLELIHSHLNSPTNHILWWWRGDVTLLSAGARCTRWWCRPVTSTGGQTSQSSSPSAPATQVTWWHLTSSLNKHLPFQITHSSNPGASLVSNMRDFLHIPEKMRRNQLNIFSDFHSGGSKAECGGWWSLFLLTCMCLGSFNANQPAPKCWLLKFASLVTRRSGHLDEL